MQNTLYSETYTYVRAMQEEKMGGGNVGAETAVTPP